MEKPQFEMPRPCSQGWEQMDPVEKDRWCARCDKKVYDFTQASAATIQQVYQQAEGRICGRLRREQLMPVPSGWSLKHFVLALWLVFGTSLFSGVQAQNDTIVFAEEQYRTFTIEVKDASGAVLPGANVVVHLEGKTQVFAESAGDDGKATVYLSLDNIGEASSILVSVFYIAMEPQHFCFQIDSKAELNSAALRASYLELTQVDLGEGFELRQWEGTLEVRLSEDPNTIVIGEVVMPPRWQHKFRRANPFKKQQPRYHE
ncbi:MAG: hypothetical protein ACFB10_14245 [Salibacteraceae bacterium]